MADYEDLMKHYQKIFEDQTKFHSKFNSDLNKFKDKLSVIANIPPENIYIEKVNLRNAVNGEMRIFINFRYDNQGSPTKQKRVVVVPFTANISEPTVVQFGSHKYDITSDYYINDFIDKLFSKILKDNVSEEVYLFQ